jgi:hypothetical protein
MRRFLAKHGFVYKLNSGLPVVDVPWCASDVITGDRKKPVAGIDFQPSLFVNTKSILRVSPRREPTFRPNSYTLLRWCNLGV